VEAAVQAPLFLNVGKSLKDSRWVFPSIEQDVVARIAQQHSLPEYVARMLHLRGVGPDDVESFLYPTLRAHFPDPFSLIGMKAFAEDAAKRIIDHSTIGILADFDVDGSTSAAILTRFLRHCGMMPPLYIPCRLNEGYGPNLNAVQVLKNDGAQMIIMVDCGTTSFEAVSSARNLGMDVAIFDHHEQEATLPDANHVINPKRNDDTSGLSMLAACGVTFLACVAINNVLKREKFYDKAGIGEPNMKQWIDLVGLGTVCDMVPMTGPNRLLVRAGFHQMSLKTNMGIKALCEVGNLANAPTFTDAGFVIGPRINAGSRVHKSDLGAKLLSTDNIDEARSIAYLLDECNEQRKSIQSKMMKEAIEKVEKDALDQHAVIIVGDTDWHPGLSGLVAGRLKERYGKPAICVTYAENSEGVLEGRGSGRSIIGVNLAQCFIEARNQELLVKGGGHAMAGGFTVMPDRLPEFREFLSKNITAQMEHMDLTQETVIDGIASIRGAQSQFVRLVSDHIGPFGPQNTEPVFALANVRVQMVDVLKDKHIRVQMSDWEGGPRMKAMFFYGIGTKLGETLLNHGQRLLHFAGQFQINNWQGRESVEFLISDAAVASESQQNAA
jgi:single-stranded-DNA-specific exonuclease